MNGLGLLKVESSMYPSLMGAGARGVMSPGMMEMLDVVTPIPPLPSPSSAEIPSSSSSRVRFIPLLFHPPFPLHLFPPLPPAQVMIEGGELPKQHHRRTREGRVQRQTKETSIDVHVLLDQEAGGVENIINTGIGFLDHMIGSNHSIIPQSSFII